MLRFLVSVTLPSLLFATVWIGLLGFWAARRIRRYKAGLRDIRVHRRVIQQAQDALAMVISDSLASGSTREQALPAYEALGKLLDEKEISS